MKVLKILGIIIGSFLGVFLLIFFLYPIVNKEKFETMLELEEDESVGNIWSPGHLSEEEYELMKKEINTLQAMNRDLLDKVDSLEVLNADLLLEIREWEKMDEFLPVDGSPVAILQEMQDPRIPDEEFSERIKSLLNLDEEELAPIVRQMKRSELIRMYRHSGTIQREKLLRSLDPRVAADLMSEVML